MTGEMHMHPRHILAGSANHRGHPAAGPTVIGRRRASSRQDAFTLIEIMAVVLIMGFLAGIVGVAVVAQIDKARVTTTRTQIKQLEAALTFFQMENGFFPSTDQGLEALVEKPTAGREVRSYREGGYLQGGVVPLDAWQSPFLYESPGQVNRDYDIWSLGADAVAGGTGVDADIGNWAEEIGAG
jgi:general secretion pathway protein G